MKNVLRILMLVLIVGAVFFASDFLMKQNENYDSNNEQKIEETANQNLSGEDLLENLPISDDEDFSGELEAFSGEVVESGFKASVKGFGKNVKSNFFPISFTLLLY